MRLGLQLSLAGPDFSIDMNLIREAEALGFDSIWTGEAYGSDAVTPITWVLANTNRIFINYQVSVFYFSVLFY